MQRTETAPGLVYNWGFAAMCKVGRVLGGGFDVGQTEIIIQHSKPTDDRRGWWVNIWNPHAVAKNVTVWAVCASG